MNDLVMINPEAIAFDIDGVFADIMMLFIEIAYKRYQIDWIKYEDITSYAIADCLDLDPDIIRDILTRIIDGNYDEPLSPIPGAAEVLTRLGRTAPPILFVTARPYPGPIEKWIHNTLPLDPQAVDIITTGSFDGKGGVLVEKKITHFVEDRLETCFLLEKAGITPILFKQPWNREPHPFIEVDGWKNLECLIEFDQ